MTHLAHRWLDRLFGAALAGALLMLAVTTFTAWPGPAQAADRVEGDGEAVTEQRGLEAIDAIQTSGFKVSVRQGSANTVSVQADRNLLPLLETVVEPGREGLTLVIRWKRNTSLKTRITPVIQVTAVAPKALLVQGSGDILADGLKLPQLAARVSGSGDVRLSAVATDELTLEITGSGDILASGQSGRLMAKISGSGDIKAGGLRADDVSVRIAGSGDADVQARRTLDVSIAGSGDVRHTGNATVQTQIAGSGTVKRY